MTLLDGKSICFFFIFSIRVVRLSPSSLAALFFTPPALCSASTISRFSRLSSVSFRFIPSCPSSICVASVLLRYGLHSFWQIQELYFIGVGKDHEAFDDIFKLSDIAGPVVVLQAFDGGLGHVLLGNILLRGNAV